MAKFHRLLHSTTFNQCPPTFLFLHTFPADNHHRRHLRATTTSADAANNLPRHRFLLSYVCRSRRWDSNAEPIRKETFGLGYAGDREDDDLDDDVEQWTEVLEDYVDSIWIFKVFRSYGWTLPAILASLLLSSGPKAFLMALALPLGQSTLTFAFQRLRDKGKSKRKRKTGTKKSRSRARRTKTITIEEEELVKSQRMTEKKMGVESWISKEDISSRKSEKTASSFGGWDELVTIRTSNIGSSSRPARETIGSQRLPKDNSKLSEGNSTVNLPLLLRLLIAVFPFLSSWTKML